MNVLGVHDGHASSACLVRDGRLVAAMQEERLTREKNRGGAPERAIARVLQIVGLPSSSVDAVAFSTTRFCNRQMISREDVMNVYRRMFMPHEVPTSYPQASTEALQTERVAFLAELGIPRNRVRFIDHHSCHAATAYYARGSFDRDVLVLTNDGQGDGLCATVSVGRSGKLERVAEVAKSDSVAALYSFVTFLLGFVPLEHEYKLMGMSPYAEDSPAAHKVCRLLEDLFDSPVGLIWRRRPAVPVSELLPPYLSDLLRYQRFDCVMAGLQLFTENFVTRWVANTVEETGIGDLALGGGIFMNVKLNKRIVELPRVRSAFFCPSCGDESNSLGAAWLLAQHYGDDITRFEPLPDLYIGPAYTASEVAAAVRDFPFGKKIRITQPADIGRACAGLLAENQVVARFSGRMEFGARALGNRSILANPSRPEMSAEINRMIKMRDFWMPFAPAVLEEDVETYLDVRRTRSSPFMTLAFDVLPAGRTPLRAAIHAHDGTCRPQIVVQKQNPSFHRLIGRLKELTGIGAILNTSFNLHGYPIVESPADALKVFDVSGLRYLALEDHLIEEVA